MLARKPGARGPLKMLYARLDRDAIMLDLMTYQQQKATGVAQGEERLTLESLGRKYKTSPKTLQGWTQHVTEMIDLARSYSEAVGIAPMDFVAGTKRHYNETIELLEAVKEKAIRSGEFEEWAHVLQNVFPIALDRLQMALPKEPEEAPEVGANRAEQRGVNLQLINLIQGREQEETPVVKLQRSIEG